MNPNIDGEVLDKSNLKFQEPGMWKIILLNDDYTTMEFVVYMLIKVFGKTTKESVKIMLSVHEQGRGIVGTYVKDIAETKVKQVHDLAKEHGSPLKCIMEEA